MSSDSMVLLYMVRSCDIVLDYVKCSYSWLVIYMYMYIYACKYVMPFVSSNSDQSSIFFVEMPAITLALCEGNPSVVLALCEGNPSVILVLCEGIPSVILILCEGNPSMVLALCERNPSVILALCEGNPMTDGFPSQRVSVIFDQAWSKFYVYNLSVISNIMVYLYCNGMGCIEFGIGCQSTCNKTLRWWTGILKLGQNIEWSTFRPHAHAIWGFVNSNETQIHIMCLLWLQLA